MTIDIACGPITWSRTGMSEDEKLADIAAAGYAGAPWPRTSEDPAAVAEQFKRHGLRPAPGYFGADFWNEAKRDEQVATARRYGQLSQALGVTEIYLAASGFDLERPGHRTRRQAAGNVTAADALSDAEFQQLAEGVTAVANATLEYGVRSCFHNHVGSFVETRAEVEKLLSLTGPELFLGPDTGHLEWAGDDPVAFCRDHLDRVLTVHIKDIGKQALEQGKAEDWDYGTYSKNGIFTELGEGVVDWDAFFSLFRDSNWSGWLVVETDVTQLPTPKDSAIASRQALARWGL